MSRSNTIRVQHALARLEKLVIAREAAAVVWRADGQMAEFCKWKVLERKTARQRNKIARAFHKII